MEQLRLFVGLPFDAGLAKKINKQFLSLDLPWPAIKTVLPEQMHITLRFLGAVPLEKLPEVIAALEQVNLKLGAIDLSIDKVLASPKSRPEIISLQIADQPQLKSLHDEIEEIFYQAGLAHKENRQYHPHLTLARIKKNINYEELKALDNWSIKEQFSAYNFNLVQSELTPRGPIYTILQSFEL